MIYLAQPLFLFFTQRFWFMSTPHELKVSHFTRRFGKVNNLGKIYGFPDYEINSTQKCKLTKFRYKKNKIK